MLGQGRPTFVDSKLRGCLRRLQRRCAPARRARWAGLTLILLSALATNSSTQADEISVRLRVVWGAGARSPQPWTGAISATGATLSELQPLGVEADEAAALQLVDGKILLTPLVPRSFDGCDVTVTGNELSELRFEIAVADAAEPAALNVPLVELVDQTYRSPLGNSEGHLLVARAPGDALRVQIDRSSLVFGPNEDWKFNILPDVRPEEGEASVPIVTQLRAAGSDDVLWENTQTWEPGADPLALSLTCPAAEGAYVLEIVARGRERFARRLLPGQTPAALARRSVEFVVIDPEARLPALSTQWDPVLTIDPANPRWWQRLPAWTKVSRIPGVVAPRPLGNVSPEIQPYEVGEMVELPATPEGAERAWQAYTLPVRRPGVPHAVELELPGGRKQQLMVSVVEPDAAGRVISFGRDAGVFCDGAVATDRGNASVHRLVFWPRTTSPVLLVANTSSVNAAAFGKIRLVSQIPTAATPDSGTSDSGPPSRFVAAYLATPRLFDCFGASERYDAASGLSITGWDAALKSGTRLAQRLKLAGYNGAIVSIAADGASLAPGCGLGDSPRHDNGLLAADGGDVMPKDVLEALLRIFDREGLRLIPAVQLAAPMPALESLSRETDGAEWIGADGRSWRQATPAQAVGPHYNLLKPEVQNRLGEIIDALADRYDEHPAFSGVALQLSGQGYGLLPDADWGLDDDAVARFAAATGLDFAASGQPRFAERAILLTGKYRDAWQAWRSEQLTGFYARLASRLQQEHGGATLTLCVENALVGAESQRELRKAVAGRGSFAKAFSMAGLDVATLAQSPGVAILRPRRIGPSELVEQQVVDRHVNMPGAIDAIFEAGQRSGALSYHVSTSLGLPSFDAQSPFGPERTALSLDAALAPSGAEARRILSASFAADDPNTVVDGADLWLTADNDQMPRIRRTIAALPTARAEVRTDRIQPVTMRTYRGADSTTVCLLNEASWPVRLTLTISTSQSTELVQLGVTAASESLSPGEQRRTINLAPHDVQGWRLADPGVRVDPPQLEANDLAEDDLRRRIHSLDARMQNLDIRRPYNQLDDPGFELSAADHSTYWQPRRGRNGSVRFDVAGKTGQRALRLVSSDSVGVAAQSNLFPVPRTGQLTVSAAVRGESITTDARLHISVETESGGQSRRQFRSLGGDELIGGHWTAQEFVVDDLPLEEDAQTRVQFHLTGDGEVWIDDVALFDLEFTSHQRIELAKRVYAAKTALDEGKPLDCLRHVDSFWPRRLVDHVPPLQVARAPQPPKEAPVAPAAEEKSSRWLPRLWR